MNFEELYQELILDHSKRPRNFGEVPGADRHAHGNNPMCGDDVTLHVRLGEGDRIEAIGFTGSGCSICMASASMLTQKAKGRTRAEVAVLADGFSRMLTSESEGVPDDRLGDLRALSGVRQFPLRVKCATLPWHALEQALDGDRPRQTDFSDE